MILTELVRKIDKQFIVLLLHQQLKLHVLLQHVQSDLLEDIVAQALIYTLSFAASNRVKLKLDLLLFDFVLVFPFEH